MSDVARIEPKDDGVLRFYRAYGRRPSDFAVLEEEFDCRKLGGAKAEYEAKKCAANWIKRGYDVKVDLCLIYPIMEAKNEPSP